MHNTIIKSHTIGVITIPNKKIEINFTNLTQIGLE